MKKYFILSLFVLLLSFSGKVYAHCGDAEAHAAASQEHIDKDNACLLYTSPSPRDGLLSRMPSSA